MYESWVEDYLKRLKQLTHDFGVYYSGKELCIKLENCTLDGSSRSSNKIDILESYARRICNLNLICWSIKGKNYFQCFSLGV